MLSSLLMGGIAEAAPAVEWNISHGVKIPPSYMTSTAVYNTNTSELVTVGSRLAVYKSADDGLSWTTTSNYMNDPLWDGISSNSIAYSDTLDLYVVVGSSSGLGSIFTSTDLVNWSVPVTSVTTNLTWVIWANGQFIAVGNGGRVYTSLDGSNWTLLPSFTTRSLTGIIYAHGRYVVIGTNGYNAYSDDLVTWTAGTGVSTSYTLSYITETPTGFFLCGDRSAYISSDATAWTPLTGFVSSTNFRTCGFHDGRYILGFNNGRIQTSTDGSTWTTYNFDYAGTFYAFFLHNGSGFLIGGNGFIMKTSTGTWWDLVCYNGDIVGDIAYSPALDRFVALASNVDDCILVSNDGVNWQARFTDMGEVLTSVTYGAGLFIAIGYDGAILHSSDGYSWDYAAWQAGFVQRAIVWTGYQFIVVGDSYQAAVSTDGLTWTYHNTGQPYGLYKIAYSDNEGLCVAVGDYGTIMTTIDGTSWQLQTSPTTQDLYDVEYINNEYVAVGQGGIIISSPFGNVWTVREGGLTVNPKIAYSLLDNRFIAPSTLGHYYRFDGMGDARWAMQNHIVDSIEREFKCAYYFDTANITPVWMMGNSYGRIEVSPDGENWTVKTTGNNFGVNAIAYDGMTTFLAGKNNGTASISTDNGNSWTLVTVGTSYEIYEAIHTAEFGFVLATGNGDVWFSSSGSTGSWTSQNTGQSNPLYSLANFNGTLITGSINGQLFTSDDGMTWTPTTVSGAGNVISIAVSPTLVIAVFGNNKYATSTDGLTWSTAQTCPTISATGACYLPDIQSWYMTGGHGQIFWSDNGTDWVNEHDWVNTVLFTLTDVGGKYLVAGQYTTGIGNIVAKGTSVEHMQIDATLRNYSMNSFYTSTYADGLMIVAGEGGIILRSPPF